MFAEIRHVAGRSVCRPAPAPQLGKVGGVLCIRRDLDVARVHDGGAPRDVNETEGVAELVRDHDGERISRQIIIDEDLAARRIEEAVRGRGGRLKEERHREARRATERQARPREGVPPIDRGASSHPLVDRHVGLERDAHGLTRIEAGRGRAAGCSFATSCCERKDEQTDDEDEAQTSGHVRRRS